VIKEGRRIDQLLHCPALPQAQGPNPSRLREGVAEMRIETRGQRAAAWSVAAAMFVVLMIVTPKIPQDQKYHQFADKRNFFGEWIAGLSEPL
jgi:hypothetical protein